MCCFLPFGAKVFLSGGSRAIGHRRGNPSDGRRCAFPSYQTLRATLAGVLGEPRHFTWARYALHALRLLRLSALGELIIGAMMRKLLHVAFGLLKSGKMFDQSLHLA